MTYLKYINNKLHFGVAKNWVNLDDFQAYYTPFYCYHSEVIKDRVDKMKSALPRFVKIHFAVKSNSNIEILKLLKSQGCGVDIVSGGELKRVLEAGFKGNDVIFSGVGKTRSEIEFAVREDVLQINVESPAELDRIGKVAQEFKKKVNVAFRLNPNVRADTHPYVTTGIVESKFGMDERALSELREILLKYPKFLKLTGLTMHIGSQIFDLKNLSDSIDRLIEFYFELNSLGYAIQSLDIGGGLGVHYDRLDLTEEEHCIIEYGKMISEKLGSLQVDVITEPGRWLMARSGCLVTEIQYIKKTEYKNFVIIDSGMHHLLRPALYQSFHQILPVQQRKKASVVYDVVGPICESADFLGKDRLFGEIQQGDRLVICDTGAYGFTMASFYNLHDLPKEILI